MKSYLLAIAVVLGLAFSGAAYAAPHSGHGRGDHGGYGGHGHQHHGHYHSGHQHHHHQGYYRPTYVYPSYGYGTGYGYYQTRPYLGVQGRNFSLGIGF